MANTAANVSTGKPKVGGSIHRALLSSSPTIPTDCTTALSGFTCLGYVSEDGLKHNMSNDNEDIKAWGGDVVLTIKNSRTDEFQFTLLEVKDENVLKAVFGDANVTVAAATTTAPKTISIASNNDDSPACAWVIEMVMRDGDPKRIVIPNGKITEIGEIDYKDDEAVGYDITIAAEADSNGNTHYEYMTVGDKLPNQ